MYQPPTGGSFRNGETLSKRLPEDRATGTAMPGIKSPWVGYGTAGRGQHTPKGRVQGGKSGRVGPPPGGGGQDRDVPGGGQDPESAATPKPKQKAGVDSATAYGRRGAEQAEHL